MKKLFLLQITLLVLLPALVAAVFDTEDTDDGPRFLEFNYTGCDAVYRENPLDSTNFYNPILQGFYPDPSLTRKGDDYYMVCSSFAYFPGVPIFHSTDLVNWTQIGNVLSRPSQLKLDGLDIKCGIYAPVIRYNPYNDTFYMITTLVGGLHGGNFLVKAKDPAGEWSDPVWLPQVGGIDPSLFFDDNGKAYIVHNAAPNGKPLYPGHRTIRMWEFDVQTDKVVSGGDVVINGGVDIRDKPIWIEGPHMYKKNGTYYIMCAEGGTDERHSEVIFSSDKVGGRYKPAEKNPILTQRHLDENRPYPVTCSGHADIISTPEGDYYAVFLACRPYAGDKYNTGRETFILPVDWSGKFPLFKGGLEPIRPTLPLPKGVVYKAGKSGYFPNGNFIYIEKFRGDRPDPRWIAIRGAYDDFAKTGKNGLELTPLPVDITEQATPAFIGYRQQHLNFKLRTVMEYTPHCENDLAGVVCYQNEGFNYVLGVTVSDGVKKVVLEKTLDGKTECITEVLLPGQYSRVTLAVDGRGRSYNFGYSADDCDIEWISHDQDGSLLSTAVAGGFTGCILGLYTTSGR